MTFGRPEKNSLRTRDRASRKSAKTVQISEPIAPKSERDAPTNAVKSRTERQIANDPKRRDRTQALNPAYLKASNADGLRADRERRNHLNHSHAKCRFADTNTRHLNLGKAPAKKTKPASSSSGGKNHAPSQRTNKPAAKAASTSTSSEKRLCYICSSENHLANACPQKEQNKSRARKTLTKDRNFMALWDEKFQSTEEKQCADRILDAWDDSNVCPICIQQMDPAP